MPDLGLQPTGIAGSSKMFPSAGVALVAACLAACSVGSWGLPGPSHGTLPSWLFDEDDGVRGVGGGDRAVAARVAGRKWFESGEEEIVYTVHRQRKRSLVEVTGGDNPAGEGVIGDPAVEGVIGDPAVEGVIGDPAVEGIIGDPAMEGIIGDPAVEGVIGNPAVEGVIGDPAGESVIGDPRERGPRFAGRTMDGFLAGSRQSTVQRRDSLRVHHEADPLISRDAKDRGGGVATLDQERHRSMGYGRYYGHRRHDVDDSSKISLRSLDSLAESFLDEFEDTMGLDDTNDYNPEGKTPAARKKLKKSGVKKLLLPLLLAYKLKFFALVPLMLGGLVLMVGSTGMAGFFFALFTAVMTLRSGHHSF